MGKIHPPGRQGEGVEIAPSVIADGKDEFSGPFARRPEIRIDAKMTDVEIFGRDVKGLPHPFNFRVGEQDDLLPFQQPAGDLFTPGGMLPIHEAAMDGDHGWLQSPHAVEQLQ